MRVDAQAQLLLYLLVGDFCGLGLECTAPPVDLPGASADIAPGVENKPVLTTFQPELTNSLLRKLARECLLNSYIYRPASANLTKIYMSF
jgi:hypothetical protein